MYRGGPHGSQRRTVVRGWVLVLCSALFFFDSASCIYTHGGLWAENRHTGPSAWGRYPIQMEIVFFSAVPRTEKHQKPLSTLHPVNGTDRMTAGRANAPAFQGWSDGTLATRKQHRLAFLRMDLPPPSSIDHR